MHPPSRMLASAAILIAMLAAAAGVRGSTPPSSPSFAERVDVQLVNLEVFVTDAKGRPVTDLAAKDFRVFEDGRPVELQHFAWVDGGKAGTASPLSSSTGENAAPEAPVRVVVVLDEEHTRAQNRAALFSRLGEVLGERLPRGSQVMIWRYEHGMQVLLPFTGSRRDLLAALDRAARTISAGQINSDEDWNTTLSLLYLDATGRTGGPCIDGPSIARGYSEEKQAEVRRTIAALGRLVGTLDGLPGRKLVLYVSDGLPLRPGEEAWETYLELCGGRGASSGRKDAMDVSAMSPAAQAMRPDPEKERLEGLTFDTSKEWDTLAARANGEGVSLYSLVTRGPAAFTPAIQHDAPESGPSALILGGAEANRLDAAFLMASETGGRLIYNGAEVGKALAGIVDDLSFYLLGYPAPNPGDGRIRRLRVEVARSGVQVRHRRSYALKSDDQRASDKLLTRLYYDVGENTLGLKLTPKSAEPKDPARTTRLQVAVPLRGLTLVSGSGAEQQLQGLITVYVVSRDAGGSATPVRRRLLTLHFPASEAASVRQRAFLYEVAMQLPKGNNDVAVAVRDEFTGEISFAGQAVRVPR
jgi:VWFA-related protein